MIRSWGVNTLGASSQPWFGDVTTAAVGLPDSFGKISVTVASTARYQAGDRILVGPQTATQDVVKVDSIASSTVLNCQSEGNAKTHTHVTNTQIMLDIACAEIIITNLASDQPVWLGSDNTVTNTGGGSGFYPIEPVTGTNQPNSFRVSNSVNSDAIRTSEGWIVGTNGRTYSAAAIVV